MLRTSCPDLATALHEGTEHIGADSALLQLLEVQFWLMGRDVEHPEGNLLVRMGFTRETAPADAPVRSRYRRVSRGDHVLVWPWGIYLAQRGEGVLLRRGDLAGAALVGPAPDAFLPPAPPASSSPCTPRSLATACRWFASYEGVVAATVGVDHRVPRPGSSPRLAPPEPWALSAAWLELGTAIRPDSPSHARHHAPSATDQGSDRWLTCSPAARTGGRSSTATTSRPSLPGSSSPDRRSGTTA